MCVGAFTGAFFSIFFEDAIPYAWIRFPLALIIGGLAAALFGAFIGVTVLRLRGDYLAIVTLAFGEIVKNIVNILYVGRDADGLHFSTESKLALHLKEGGKVLINGAQGISGTPKNSSFLIGIILVLVTVIVTLNLIHSRTGRAIMPFIRWYSTGTPASSSFAAYIRAWSSIGSHSAEMKQAGGSPDKSSTNRGDA